MTTLKVEGKVVVGDHHVADVTLISSDPATFLVTWRETSYTSSQMRRAVATILFTSEWFGSFTEETYLSMISAATVTTKLYARSAISMTTAFAKKLGKFLAQPLQPNMHKLHADMVTDANAAAKFTLAMQAFGVAPGFANTIADEVKEIFKHEFSVTFNYELPKSLEPKYTEKKLIGNQVIWSNPETLEILIIV